MFVLPFASGLPTLAKVLSESNPFALALFLVPTGTSIAITALLVAGLLARSRFAHAAAVVVVVAYLMAGSGDLLATEASVNPLSVIAVVIGVATLVALALDRRRYWPSSSSRSAIGVDNLSSAVLYVILTIAALSTSLWVFYYATFGLLLRMDNPGAGPPVWLIVVAAMAVLAIAAGGAILGRYAIVGSILSDIGLAVTTVAFASVYSADDDIPAQVFKLGVPALAVAGVAPLALRPWRSQPIG